jgi:hypothetical protein
MKGTTIPVIPRQLDPREITHTTTTRYQRSDGTFKQERIYYNANDTVVKKDILFGVPGMGVFKLNNPQGPLEFLSSMSPKDKTSYVRVDDGHGQPNFVRDEWVQGHQTYVLRFTDDDGGYLETYCAPEIDGQPVRRVNVSPGGVSIQEVVQITFGDPDDKVFGPLPNLAVNYELFKKKIAKTKEAGNYEAAEALQQQLDAQIAKQMYEQ